jgi:putative endopeptidase
MTKTIYSLAITALFLQSCASPDKKAEISKNQYQTIDVSALDRTIKPADDFFVFANGTWVANTTIPASESRWGSFNELEQQNNIKLKTILEDAAKDQGAVGSQNQILGAYYKSFTDLEKRNQLGKAPLTTDLSKIDQIQNASQIQALVADFHRDGIGTLFGYGIGQDLMNVNINVAYMGQGGIGLPNRDYYFEEKYQSILTAYQNHITTTLKLAGLQLDGNVAADIVALETALAGAMLRPAEMREPEKTYNKQSLAEVSSSLGNNFDFSAYLKAVGSAQSDSIIVSNPAFNTKVAELLRTVDLNTWKNYFKWSLVNHYAGHLNTALVQANFDFYEGVLSGKKEQQPIEEQAIEAITNLEIGELLGKAFVEKHFSKAAQDRVNEMVDNLLIVYRERISQLDWMTDVTKQEALKKLNSIGRKLGFPSKWEDYSMLKFNPETYVANVREMARYSVQKNFAELGKPVDKEKWGMPAHMVNAYYHPLLNEIAFPAGIMQAPFFDERAEDAVNYGRIGMVIGHEFTHGFDDMGSKFAADGSFTNWWTEEDRQLFEEKTKLLGATFEGFCPMENHCVNPDLTMGENIADLGGLTMAFYAYKRTEEFKKQEIREGFTPAQRFFIAYAQLWKIKYTDAEMKKRLATDPHSPGMYRVNGPLKNCPEFFEAFEIEEGREMRNDVKRVARIW